MKISFQDPSYAMAGDVVHILTLISTLSFAGMAGKYMHDESNHFFDEAWKQDGFCVTNKEVPYLNSHDLCFYVDVAMAILLAAFYFLWRNDAGMERANVMMFTGIPGIIFHGLGHGGVGKNIREGILTVADGTKLTIEWIQENSETTLQAILQHIPAVLFWLFLSKASMPNLDMKYVLALAVLVDAWQLFIPVDFGFTYTQTILMIQFSLNQLARDRSEKDFAYFLYPTLVGLPLVTLGWLESTMCTAFVKDYLYGHLAYDAWIPLSMLCWYATIHSTAAKQGKVKTV